MKAVLENLDYCFLIKIEETGAEVMENLVKDFSVSLVNRISGVVSVVAERNLSNDTPLNMLHVLPHWLVSLRNWEFAKNEITQARRFQNRLSSTEIEGIEQEFQ